MAAEVDQALRECEADDGVRAVVITGAGRAFCAGADLARGADSFGASEAPRGRIPEIASATSSPNGSM